MGGHSVLGFSAVFWFELGGRLSVELQVLAWVPGQTQAQTDQVRGFGTIPGQFRPCNGDPTAV